ncbi:MAG: MATE family efflux transporter [Clostridia bacterium]|nr:MATE family efflux transporter [Clostridia bacterium]
MNDTRKASFDLLRGKIPPMILRIAFPTTLALLTNSLFHVADALFLSKLGTNESAAVGVTFALQVLFQAIGYTCGTGGGSLVSRYLGKGEHEPASQVARAAFLLAISFGFLITGIGQLFLMQLLPLLGAREEIYPYAIQYLRVFLWSAPAVCSSFTLSQLLRSEGLASFGMYGLVVANLVNILLDPLFIFHFGLELQGAAFSTLISQWLGCVILILVYLTKNSKIKLFSASMKTSYRRIPQILLAGLPSLLRQGLICVATVMLNHGAAAVGVSAVAAMSVVNRIFLLTYSFSAGIGQGMMSLIGYNSGAHQWMRVRRALSFAVIFTSLGMLLISLPILQFAPQIVAFFRPESAVVSFGSVALRALMLVLFVHGITTPCSMALQALGKPLAASLVACGRQGLFFLPLIAWLPQRFGASSVILVQPLADLGSWLFALPFLIYLFRWLGRQARSEASASP